MSRIFWLGVLTPAYILTSLSSVAAEAGIEKIQITANRNLIQSNAATADQHTVNLDELNFPFQKASDALLFSPGVVLNGQGGLWQSYNIRGLARWRIKSLVDGININIDRRAGNSLSFIDPALLSGIDVISGPSSVYYGSGAIGGVINAGLKRDDETTITLGYSSFGDERNLSITTSIEDKVYTGLAYRKAQNDENQRHQPLLSKFEQYSGYLSYDTFVLDDLELSASVIGSSANNIGKTNNQFPDSRVSIYPFEKHVLGKIAISKPRHWAFGGYFHDQKWQSDTLRLKKRRNVSDYQSFDWGLFAQQYWSLYHLEGRYGLDIDSRNNVRIDERQFSTADELQWQTSILNGDEYRGALYSDAGFKLADFSITLGSRLEHISQESLSDKTRDNFITGFAKIAAPITDSSSLLFDLGTGFRFPTLTERFFDGSTARARVLGNRSLKPEQSKNAQVKYFLATDMFEISVNGFYNHIDNYIERVAVSDDTLTYQNETRGIIYGGELGLKTELSDKLSLNWIYQFVNGKNSSGQPLADIAPDESRLLLTWHEEDWDASVNYRYRRRFDHPASGEQSLLSNHIIDLSSRHWLNDNIKLVITVKNLLDEEYLATPDDASAVMPGRHISITTSWSL